MTTITHDWDKAMTSGRYATVLHGAVAASVLQTAAKKAGYAYFHLDGKAMDGKKALFNQAATVMHLPDYFASNWDSFEECVTDFEWLDNPGFVIHFEHIEHFQQHHGAELETFIEMMIDVCEYWDEEKRPMLVVLSGGKLPKHAKKL
jgi:RNAse (barnase) inhibitor barstar